MVSLTLSTFGLATGTGAEVGAWTTAVPGDGLEGGVAAGDVPLDDVPAGAALAAPSRAPDHQL
jgi:hypothetical protein